MPLVAFRTLEVKVKRGVLIFLRGRMDGLLQSEGRKKDKKRVAYLFYSYAAHS